MDLSGRHFLVSSFFVSVIICIGSKLTEMPETRPTPSYFRLVSDGAVLVLHFIYFGSSIDLSLAHPNDSYQFLLNSLGDGVATIYAHVQFTASIVGNIYMLICASDIILEYMTILIYPQPNATSLFLWRRWVAVAATCLLTALNCYNIQWTTTTFAIYIKSLFMSFWVAKIWFNWSSIRATVTANESGLTLMMILTFGLIVLLIAIKEFDCFPQDVVSANHTVLLPLYEHLIGLQIPELPIIVSCYYADSLNSFFLSPDPFIQAAQNCQLPSALALRHEKTTSPIMLLLIKSAITVVVVGYMDDDLGLLGSTWNCLLLTGAILFDMALLLGTGDTTKLKFALSGKAQTFTVWLLHAGFQLANVGWIFHRVTGFEQVGKMLIFVTAVSIVAFRLVKIDAFVRIFCNRWKLTCCVKAVDATGGAKPPATKDNSWLDSLV
ncbi:uncharacterized protein LOC131425395 [Malaya genurostris]|uniref:uncharacterized protein LOC131425395 n=1 Tax=Malaya genurostris TaxID=325434 RepID=UPI0026F39BFF|nr:uncharacterized protein LOC131425395 [Malaya genurostris]